MSTPSLPNTVPLGLAVTYGIFSELFILNNGSTNVVGNIGVNKGLTIIGYPPGIHIGQPQINNHQTQLVKIDLEIAYQNAASRFTPVIYVPTDQINGLTFKPGVYRFQASFLLDGILTFDAENNPDAVWIFQIEKTMTVSDNSTMIMNNLAPGTHPINIFWQVADGLLNDYVGGQNVPSINIPSVHIGSNATVFGTILSQLAIVVADNATTNALFSLNGFISTSTNTVSSYANISVTGGDPHIICLDGSRLDVYEEGFYRVFDNCYDPCRVIINADIRRDPETHADHYHKIWINLDSKKEYLLEFLPQNGGIITTIQKDESNESNEQFLKTDRKYAIDHPVLQWDAIYVTSGNTYYKVTVEALYNTFLISTNETREILKYSGLMAGQIVTIGSLYDRRMRPPVEIKPYFYDQSGLIAGSSDPHVLTVYRHPLKLKNGSYRLLQWATGYLNGSFDTCGQLRQTVIVIGEKTDFWTWEGFEHWKLIPKKNGVRVTRLHVEEYVVIFGLKDSRLLIRIQGNGSISVSARQTENSVRGVLWGDLLTISGPHDDYIYEIDDPLQLELESPPQVIELSLYNRMIEPIVTGA
jgi:hypothetical protein